MHHYYAMHVPQGSGSLTDDRRLPAKTESRGASCCAMCSTSRPVTRLTGWRMLYCYGKKMGRIVGQRTQLKA